MLSGKSGFGAFGDEVDGEIVDHPHLGHRREPGRTSDCSEIPRS
jgi:hypothetical protein